MSALIVIAKAPAPGRAKTRLTPPCTPAEATSLAHAALADTLAAVRRTPVRRRVVALDGPPGAWLGGGFEVVAQRGESFGARLAAAFEDVGGPALLIAMDTPQVTPALLSRALAALERDDAVLGPTPDGGYWAIGLRTATPGAFDGVPMSTADTRTAQERRLREIGLRARRLPELTDVDDIASARAVAAVAPKTRFAAVLRRLAVTTGSTSTLGEG